MKKTDYPLLSRQMAALLKDIPYETANLANAAALLWQALPEINWVGFYRMEDSALILGPFQGKPACVRLEAGKGVCGTAAALNKTVVVSNVHTFPGHIACDAASASEIVIPIHKNGNIWGVLDVDSPREDRFTQEDKTGLEKIAAVLEQALFTY